MLIDGPKDSSLKKVLPDGTRIDYRDYIEKHPHDIAALCVADGAYAASVFDLTHIARMLEMIHYFFTVHVILLNDGSDPVIPQMNRIQK